MFILAVWLRCYHRAKDKNKKSPPIWVGEDFYSLIPFSDKAVLAIIR